MVGMQNIGNRIYEWLIDGHTLLDKSVAVDGECGLNTLCTLRSWKPACPAQKRLRFHDLQFATRNAALITVLPEQVNILPKC